MKKKAFCQRTVFITFDYIFKVLKISSGILLYSQPREPDLSISHGLFTLQITF